MATLRGNQLAQDIRQKVAALKQICQGVDENLASRAPKDISFTSTTWSRSLLFFQVSDAGFPHTAGGFEWADSHAIEQEWNIDQYCAATAINKIAA